MSKGETPSMVEWRGRRRPVEGLFLLGIWQILFLG